MSRPAASAAPGVVPAPAPKALAQQQADFTAEGSPPPGKVGLTAPESTSAGTDAKQRALDPARALVLDHLTTNQGLRLADNHNSLKAGARGPTDRKSTRLNSSHVVTSRMPSSA